MDLRNVPLELLGCVLIVEEGCEKHVEYDATKNIIIVTHGKQASHEVNENWRKREKCRNERGKTVDGRYLKTRQLLLCILDSSDYPDRIKLSQNRICAKMAP